MEVSCRIALQYDVRYSNEQIAMIKHKFHDVYSNSNKNFLGGGTGPWVNDRDQHQEDSQELGNPPRRLLYIYLLVHQEFICSHYTRRNFL